MARTFLEINATFHVCDLEQKVFPERDFLAVRSKHIVELGRVDRRLGTRVSRKG